MGRRNDPDRRRTITAPCCGRRIMIVFGKEAGEDVFGCDCGGKFVAKFTKSGKITKLFRTKERQDVNTGKKRLKRVM